MLSLLHGPDAEPRMDRPRGKGAFLVVKRGPYEQEYTMAAKKKKKAAKKAGKKKAAKKKAKKKASKKKAA